MKTITNYHSHQRGGGLLLSLLCAGVVATFLAGCADTGHITAYDSSYYYPTGNYVRDYSGYTQSYPYSDSSSGPRYRIIDGMHVYEPYYYGSYYSY